MARLDRLGTAKEVAQIGAAIGREFSHALLTAVVRKPEAELGSALHRLTEAGLLFRQGLPPHAAYLFKHALVQDAAYGTLLREPRRALHARIAETLESQFAEIAESQPELLARHCTEAGTIEKAAGFWGKAGQRSLERSALIEATAQYTRALDQIATLPSTPALRREEIKLQTGLITPLIHVKGYAAPETMAAEQRARLLIEQAEALGEPPEDPLLATCEASGRAVCRCWPTSQAITGPIDKIGHKRGIGRRDGFVIAPWIDTEVDALAGRAARRDIAPLKVRPHQIVLTSLRDHYGHGDRPHRRVLLQAISQRPLGRIMGKNAKTRNQSAFKNRKQRFPFSEAASCHVVDKKTPNKPGERRGGRQV